ncbi:MAG: 50S ribosomal protein L18e [Candidatus Aenigmatarchaeota archaeon]
MKHGTENIELKKLILALNKSKSDVCKEIAKRLSRPSRSRISMNLSDVDNNCKDNEKVVVAGKVLGSGEITKPVTIYAWQFSKQAAEKIKVVGGKVLTINDLLETNEKARLI